MRLTIVLTFVLSLSAAVWAGDGVIICDLPEKPNPTQGGK